MPSTNRAGKNRAGKRDGGDAPRSRISRLTITLGVVLFGLLAEHLIVGFLHVPQYELSLIAQFFQPLVFGGFPPPTPQLTIVEIDTPGYESPAALRESLRVLFPKIVKLRPRGIVAAVTLQELRASEEEPFDEVTSQLIAEIQSACMDIPVVFGFDIVNGAINPHVNIFTKYRSYCAEGFTNAHDKDNDFRLAPFRVQLGDQNWRSLSYAAGLLFRPGLVQDTRIQEAWTTEKSFYVPLFSREDYAPRTVKASGILADNLDDDSREKIRDHIVVIGSASDKERQTPAGPLHAHLLQAAYIEAFSSGWLLMEAPFWLHALVIVLWWLVVEYQEGPWQQFKAMVLAFVALFIIEWLLIRKAGLYSDCGLISILGVFIWAMYHLRVSTEKLAHAPSSRYS